MRKISRLRLIPSSSNNFSFPSKSSFFLTAVGFISTLGKTLTITSSTSSATAPAIPFSTTPTTPSSITSTISSTSASIAPDTLSNSNIAPVYTKSTSNNVSLGPIIGGALGDLALILLQIISLIILKRHHSPTQKPEEHESADRLQIMTDTSGGQEIHYRNDSCANVLQNPNAAPKTNNGTFPRDVRERNEHNPSELDAER